MHSYTVERTELRAATVLIGDDPGQLGLPVLLEGQLLDNPTQAQRSLAALAHDHLAHRSFTTRVGRRRDGDWTVEIAGNHGRWLAMHPVTRDCADIDEVCWEVALRDPHGQPVPITKEDTAAPDLRSMPGPASGDGGGNAARTPNPPGVTTSADTAAEAPFVREHLGVQPALVDDLVDIALATPGIQEHFQPK